MFLALCARTGFYAEPLYNKTIVEEKGMGMKMVAVQGLEPRTQGL
jgi:hypothetical protein